jgi:hypothetical protein
VKNLIALLILAAMICVVGVGCGDTKKPSSPSSTETKKGS